MKLFYLVHFNETGKQYSWHWHPMFKFLSGLCKKQSYAVGRQIANVTKNSIIATNKSKQKN